MWIEEYQWLCDYLLCYTWCNNSNVQIQTSIASTLCDKGNSTNRVGAMSTKQEAVIRV